MSCLMPYNLREQVELYVHMPSLVAMWHTPSERGQQIDSQTWDILDAVTETFSKHRQSPTIVKDADLQKLERFVIIMYARSTAATGVD